MPEGPEIKRAADRIARAIVHQPLTSIYFAFESLKSYESCLGAAQVIEVQPRGKALLTRFSNGLTVYTHNQLYGVWYVRRAKSFPQTRRQLRLAIHTAQKSALLYSASDIMVLTEDEVAGHPFLNRLGPDVLDPETTPQQVSDRLLSRTFARRRLATLLLDQQCLSGLGNYLRSEILFLAGLHPTLRPADCSQAQIQALAAATLSVPWQSYQHQGITHDLEQAKALQAEGKPRWFYRHWVFGRQGQPCHRCGDPVIKAILGGRRLYWCPTCQPLSVSDRKADGVARDVRA
ncbi:endonuclease VIII [Lyngbya confervoides]|uniref:DNA-(apurinic or apyrimidinic site) lyase n=1 Tax=Lyngbya confervoides BDU141951 TaxID=1574623 RepID=A0ABD4T8X1_9CYAN|nr:endonuclease VIII [Lyngbya confervoides]MCM1985254.1 endonuclease VIII [Lyngbya confervoides BDU141951]